MSDWFRLKLSLILFLGFFGTCFVLYSSGACCPFLKRRVSLTRNPYHFFLYCIFFPFISLFLRISFYPIHLFGIRKVVGRYGTGMGEIGWAWWVFLLSVCRLFSWKRDVLWGFPRRSIIDDCHLFVLASITSPPHAPS